MDRKPLLDAVAAAGFPTLGYSRQGQPIVGRWYVPGGRLPAWRVLVVAGVHGDEPSSVEAVLELAARLGAAPVSEAKVLIMPALNPDGLLVGRKNGASDVDLNRNFPARSFTRAHRPGYDPGPAPLSEPETALLARIIEGETIDAVVAVHAPFACVNLDGPAHRWAEAVSAACGWPVRTDIGYPTPGSLGSWLGVDRSMPVLTLELPAGPLPPFRAAAAAALDAALRHSRSPTNVPEIG